TWRPQPAACPHHAMPVQSVEAIEGQPVQLFRCRLKIAESSTLEIVRHKCADRALPHGGRSRTFAKGGAVRVHEFGGAGQAGQGNGFGAGLAEVVARPAGSIDVALDVPDHASRHDELVSTESASKARSICRMSHTFRPSIGSGFGMRPSDTMRSNRD